MVERTKIEQAIEESWSATTTYHRYFHPYKSRAEKRLGQSGSTALVLQDFLGGRIMAATVHLPSGEMDTHYYNVIDGEEVDLTREQYDFYGGTVSFEPAQEVDRRTFDERHPVSPIYDALRHHVDVVLAP